MDRYVFHSIGFKNKPTSKCMFHCRQCKCKNKVHKIPNDIYNNAYILTRVVYAFRNNPGEISKYKPPQLPETGLYCSGKQIFISCIFS